MNLNDVGNNIQSQRKRLGITQKELADKVGVTWEMISRYERGLNSPLSRIDKLSIALETTPNELLHNYFKTASIQESTANRVPLFTDLPTDFNFANKTAHVFYSAPEWVNEYNKGEVFAIVPKLFYSLSTRVSEDGLIFATHKLPKQFKQADLLLAVNRIRSRLELIQFSNINLKDSKIVALVLAQETRFK